MKNNFSFAGKDVALLARKFGTPFFLFDEAKIKENFSVLKSSFSSKYKNLRIDYSVKTNCELGILKIIKSLGSNLEISSVHELEVAKRAGFDAEQMIWDTPVKKEEEISYMLSNKIHAFYLDSLDDAQRVDGVVRRKGKRIKAVLRVNPGFSWISLSPAERFLKKFGIPKKEITSVADFIKKKCPNLELAGLSVHVGSQQITPKHHLKALRVLVSLALDLEKKGFRLEELCLGGGYPSETLTKTTYLSLALSFFGIGLRQKIVSVEEFGKQISKTFANEVRNLSSHPKLVIQPGRSLVSNSAIAVGMVTAVKDQWIFLDLSTSSLPESLFFGQRKLVLVNKHRQKPTGKYHVAGRGLNSADNLALFLPLPKPEVGDLAIVLDAGAYSISRANRFTILNPPVYLVVKTGEIKKIRRQETYEDILAPMES